MARTPIPESPERLSVGDTVESRVRGRDVPWLVRECWMDEDGLQTVIVSHPGRGAARFTWHGRGHSTLRYGLAYLSGKPMKFYFVAHAAPPEAPAVDEAPEGMPLDVWRHKNGADYRVLFVTDAHPASDARPDLWRMPHVVYETLRDPDRKWSRPLSDWHRSFTLLNRRA